MEEKVVVVGLGLFGTALVNELADLGHEVLAIDSRLEPVKEFTRENVQPIQGDGTSQALWDDLSLRDYRMGVVAFSSNVEANIVVALLLKKIGVPHIVAKSNGEHHSVVLRAIKVDVVVQPEEEMGRRLAHVLGSYIEEYVDVARDFGVAKAVLPVAFKGISCREIEDKRGATVLLIRRQDKVIVSPSDKEELREGDTVIIAGEDQALRRLAVLPPPTANGKD